MFVISSFVVGHSAGGGVHGCAAQRFCVHLLAGCAFDEIRAAQPLTTLRWDRKLDTYDGTFYLHVDSVPDGLEFAIWADTGTFTPDVIQACARELEAVTIEAALNPDAPTGIRS